MSSYNLALSFSTNEKLAKPLEVADTKNANRVIHLKQKLWLKKLKFTYQRYKTNKVRRDKLKMHRNIFQIKHM